METMQIDLSTLSESARAFVTTAAPSAVACALEIGSRALEAARAHAPSASSARIGACAELRLEHALRRRYTRVVNTSGVPESADLQVVTPLGVILVESKWYSGAVPSSGVEKFCRDIEACRPVAAAMVSRTAITGVNTTDQSRPVLRYADVGGTRIPVLYLTTDDADAAACAVELLERLATAIVENSQPRRVDSACELREHIAHAHAGLRTLVKAGGDYARDVGGVSAIMHGHLVGLGRAEASIRHALGGIEQCLDPAPSVLTRESMFPAAPDDMRHILDAVVDAASARCAAPNWRRVRNRLECVDGAGAGAGAAVAIIAQTVRGSTAYTCAIPYAFVAPSDVTLAITLGAVVSTDGVRIDVNAMTVADIVRMIGAGASD